jgi:hypothetical protein
MAELPNDIGVFIKTPRAHHIMYIMLIVFLIICGRVWLKEHDARIAAENVVKSSEAQVLVLHDQITALRAANDKKVSAIHKQAATIHTPVQAAPVLNEFDARLNARVISPLEVSVAAVPLAQDIEACRIDRTNLDACSQELLAQEKITEEKTTEIVALKKKPKFFPRLWSDVKNGSLLITIGIVIGKALL